MKDSKSKKFNELVKKMETLQEVDQGKLKGGFVVYKAENMNRDMSVPGDGILFCCNAKGGEKQ